MIAIRAKITDGQIVTPPEVRASAAKEVIIVLEDSPAPISSSEVGSIFDVIGKHPNPLTDAQLRERLKELRKDRDEWDND